jgi:hypothetical protein
MDLLDKLKVKTYRKTLLSTPVGGIATTMVVINLTLVCLDFTTNFLTLSMVYFDLLHGADVVRK